MAGLKEVQAGWQALPDEVLTSVLTAMRGDVGPSSLAWKTVVTKVTPPQHSWRKLRSNSVSLDARGAAELEEMIAGHGDTLAVAVRLFERAKAAARELGLADQREMLLNRAFDVALAYPDDLDDGAIHAIAADIAVGARTRGLPRFDAYLAQRADDDGLDALLEQLWDSRTAQRDAPHARRVIETVYAAAMRYLSVATFRSRAAASAVPHFTDQDVADSAWREIVGVDAVTSLIGDYGSYGLARTPRMTRPPLLGTLRDAPWLDRSVEQRARSAVVGAQAGRYDDTLASPDTIFALAIDSATSPAGLRTPEARAGFTIGVAMLMDADPEADPNEGSYTSRKLVRFRALMARSARSDRGRVDRLHTIIATLPPTLWSALHNLEFRGDLIHDHSQIWRRVGGETETLVRQLKAEYAEDELASGMTATLSMAHLTATVGDAWQPRRDEELDSAERVSVRAAADAQAAVHFTLAAIGENASEALDPLLRETERARSSMASFDEAREMWDALMERLVALRLPLGLPADGAQRYVEAADLATFSELLDYLDRFSTS